MELNKLLRENSTDGKILFSKIKDILVKEPYNLIVNEDEEYFILKYNQIESDMSNPIVKECRGIILRKDNFKIVCHPFYKFFNYGEARADKIDWNTAVVMEKIDGSITKVWYDKKWHVSTNGVIDASKATNPMGKTFYAMFIEGLKNAIGKNTAGDVLDFFNTLNPDYTYMFEMVHPLNRIVVRHEKPMLYHIGTRNNITHTEINEDINIPKPKTYSFNNLEEVLAMAEKLPYSEEGYVVVDGDWNRVKIKSPSYLAVHHLKNNGVVTYKRILKLILQGETDEFLAYFPEFKPYFDKAQAKYDDYLASMTKVINDIKTKTFDNRKDYALAVVKSPCPDFFFKVLDKKYNFDQFSDYVQEAGAEWLSKTLKLKDEEAKDV